METTENVRICDSSGTTTTSYMNDMMAARKQYGVPENYNPFDHPPVKMRHQNTTDRSETQRKRRSKNRLSNRRSTGYISNDVVDEALKMGPTGENGKTNWQENNHEN